MNPLRAWNRFWFSPISARPLGAFRIVLGLVLLANLAMEAFDIDYWYTDAGLLQGSCRAHCQEVMHLADGIGEVG